MKALKYYIILYLSIHLCTAFQYDRIEECHRNYHSCLSGPKNIYCRCDQLCTSYDDCCFDAKDGAKKNPIQDIEHRQFLNRTSCEDIHFDRRKSTTRPSVFMVTACPTWPNVDENVRNKCEQRVSNNVLDLLPVTVSDTGVTFKNRHCAKCNGKLEWTPWLLNISCTASYFAVSRQSWSLTVEVMLRLLNAYCIYNFEPQHDIKVRYCYRIFEYNIYSSLEWTNVTTCGDRIFKPLYNHLEFHRNSQCFFDAHGTNFSTDAECFVSFDQYAASKNIFTLSSLIDVSALLQTPSGIVKCKDAEIHLSDKVGCQQLYCPNNMEPFGGSCGELEYTENGKLLDILLELNFALNSSSGYVNRFNIMLNSVFSRLNDCIIYIPGMVLFRFSSYQVIPGHDSVTNKVCSMMTFQYPMKEKPNSKCTLQYKRQLVYDVVLNFTEANSFGSSVRLVTNIDNSSCKCNVSLSNPMFVMNQFHSTNNLPCPAVKVHLFHANESLVHGINGSMLNTMDEDSMYFEINGTVVDLADVVLSNGDFFVCIDTFILKYQGDANKYTIHFRTIINTVCTCVSMLCLAYSMVQYCVVPFLRNGKSDLILVLITFIFLAQTCFLLMSYLTIVNEFCEWLGVLHHFAWLGSFIFMFLCSFRLHAELRDLKTYSKLEHTFKTVKYTVIGFCCVIAVVLCTKLTNLYAAPLTKWYGGRLCFISEAYVLICAFIVPMLLVLCGNTALFVSIILYICKTSKPSISKTIKPMLFVFIKISSIMGFSWIIGIVAMVAESEVLLIIFENVASLQGMLISVSFACNHRIWSYYKNRRQEDSRPHETNSSRM